MNVIKAVQPNRNGKKYRKLNALMRKKLAGLFVFVVLAFICLLIRMTYINASSGARYKRTVLANSQSQYSSTSLAYKRGDILDRNGNVLAASEKRYNVILDCFVVNSNEAYKEPTITALVNLFGADELTIRHLLEEEKTKSSQYQVVAEKVTVEDKQAFDQYKEGSMDTSLSDDERNLRANTKGIWFEEEYVRVYPMGQLAGDVLGFVYDKDKADWGLEGYFNNTLCGVDGRKYGYWGSDSQIEQTIVDPVDGDTIKSTLDTNIQAIVENVIGNFESIYKNGPYSQTAAAKHIGVVVMNPNNGQILAMANSEQYDPNNPRDLSAYYPQSQIDAMSSEQKADALNEIWKNFCVSDAYEPGSVFKPVTVSSALECGALSGAETFYCDGYETVAGIKIKCSDTEGHGQETLKDVVKNSCNDGLMQIGNLMGIDDFCKYQRLFGFGSRTGIDLSGESSGIIGGADTMGSVDLATATFGQGFTCTMVQEIAAISAVINGGNYFRPHMVSCVQNSDGVVSRSYDNVLMKEALSPDVSECLRDFMRASVESGTSQYAKVDGYSMGGKTGTAQKIPRGNGKYLVSWIGFVPAEDPQVLIYCVVDEPNVPDQADNRYPQWIARDILRQILPYMGIYPDEPTNSENEYLKMDFDNPTGEKVITSPLEMEENTVEEETPAQEDEGRSYIASIDEDGNLLNEDGHFIDAEGYLINDDLNYVDENDNVIDEEFKIRAGEKSKAPKSGDETLNEDDADQLGTATADTVADTNVPEVQGNEDASETAGGNTLEADGYTNEEAGLV